MDLLENVVGSAEDLEDDGTLDSWLARVRNPGDFQRGVRVRTSPKRVGDPIKYGTISSERATNHGGDWKVSVLWDNEPMAFSLTAGISNQFNDDTTDVRSLYPLEEY